MVTLPQSINWMELPDLAGATELLFGVLGRGSDLGVTLTLDVWD